MTYTRVVPKEPLSEAIQHYLREIYKLAQTTSPVSITALAKAQGVSAASASAMGKKLAALGLAEHAPYRGCTLTAAGERVAREARSAWRALSGCGARSGRKARSACKVRRGNGRRQVDARLRGRTPDSRGEGAEVRTRRSLAVVPDLGPRASGL